MCYFSRQLHEWRPEEEASLEVSAGKADEFLTTVISLTPISAPVCLCLSNFSETFFFPKEKYQKGDRFVLKVAGKKTKQ